MAKPSTKTNVYHLDMYRVGLKCGDAPELAREVSRMSRHDLAERKRSQACARKAATPDGDRHIRHLEKENARLRSVLDGYHRRDRGELDNG